MSATVLATRPADVERDSRAAAASRTVLVVDDDPGVRDLLRFILEGEGLVVETAENGYQGLARALYRRPSLVMLDLNVAFLSGEVVARELRATYGDSLPIVLVSGNAEVEEVAQRVGADGYLAKPFSWNGVLGVLRRSLAPAGAR